MWDGKRGGGGCMRLDCKFILLLSAPAGIVGPMRHLLPLQSLPHYYSSSAKKYTHQKQVTHNLLDSSSRVDIQKNLARAMQHIHVLIILHLLALKIV